MRPGGRARGRLALSGGGDGAVRLWRLDGAARAEPELVRSLLGHSGALISVALGATGVAASCAADRTIRLWDVHLGTCTATLLPAGAPWCVALCDETETLLSAGNGPLVHMWSCKGGSTKPAARLAAHAVSVCALAVDDGCIVSHRRYRTPQAGCESGGNRCSRTRCVNVSLSLPQCGVCPASSVGSGTDWFNVYS